MTAGENCITSAQTTRNIQTEAQYSSAGIKRPVSLNAFNVFLFIPTLNLFPVSTPHPKTHCTGSTMLVAVTELSCQTPLSRYVTGVSGPGMGGGAWAGIGWGDAAQFRCAGFGTATPRSLCNPIAHPTTVPHPTTPPQNAPMRTELCGLAGLIQAKTGGRGKPGPGRAVRSGAERCSAVRSRR